LLYLRATLIPLLLLVFSYQSRQSFWPRHYGLGAAPEQAANIAPGEKELNAALAEGYDKLGKIYLAEKKYRPAIEALAIGTSYGPDRTELWIDLAIAFFHDEKFEEALGSLNRALALNAQSASVHQMLGKTWFMLGKFDNAATELQTALRIAPNDNEVSYTLALAYLKQHQLASAQQTFRQMLGRLGDRPQLRIVFGRAYRETGYLPESIEEFKKAIALDPKFPRAHYYLGLTYLLKDGAGRLPEAEQEFKAELDSHPDEFFANYYLGIVYAMDRKWDQAVPLMQKAGAMQPANPDPYFYLGQAYQETGRYAEAVEAFKKSIALNPEVSHNDYQVARAHYRLGQALLKTGSSEAAQKELRLAAELKSQSLERDKEKSEIYLATASLGEPKSKSSDITSTAGVIAEANELDAKTAQELKEGEAYYAKLIGATHNKFALLRVDQKDFNRARDHFALAAKWDPQLDGLYFNWGLAAFKAESYRDAIGPLETESGVHPANMQAKELLGLSYFMIENYSRTSELLAQVVVAKPHNVGLYYTLAVSLIKQNKREQANQVIKQMIMMGGNTVQLHILLAQAYNEQGETAKALEELQAALAIDGKTPQVHYYSGLIYFKAGKFDEAVKEFESELTINPGDVQTRYHLAFVLLAQQKTAAGIKLMNEVIHAKPDFADAYYELGKALLQQGGVADAVQNLETAAKLAPDKSYVHYQLGRAYLAAGRKTEGDNQLEVSRQLKEKERQTKP